MYDGNLVLQERQREQQRAAGHLHAGLGPERNDRRRGGGIGGLLARTDREEGTRYYRNDANGNVTGLMDGGEAAGLYRYDPFGNLVAQSGGTAEPNLYRFSSKEFLSPLRPLLLRQTLLRPRPPKVDQSGSHRAERRSQPVRIREQRLSKRV